MILKTKYTTVRTVYPVRALYEAIKAELRSIEYTITGDTKYSVDFSCRGHKTPKDRPYSIEDLAQITKIYKNLILGEDEFLWFSLGGCVEVEVANNGIYLLSDRAVYHID